MLTGCEKYQSGTNLEPIWKEESKQEETHKYGFINNKVFIGLTHITADALHMFTIGLACAGNNIELHNNIS